MVTFRLSEQFDHQRVASAFRASGRVVVEPFLAEDAATALAHDLASRRDWRHILNSRNDVFEIGRSELEALPQEERARIDAAVAETGRGGFQYRYDTIRVPDEAAARAARGDLLDRFALWMSEQAMVELWQAIIGAPVDFADAQATAYHPGDFLPGHDDAVAGKHRRAAYVLGLTPGWRTEWGGLLLFHGDVRSEAIVPGFNRLTLFSVPQMHSVSYVSPLAGRPRHSITGWLREFG